MACPRHFEGKIDLKQDQNPETFFQYGVPTPLCHLIKNFPFGQTFLFPSFSFFFPSSLFPAAAATSFSLFSQPSRHHHLPQPPSSSFSPFLLPFSPFLFFFAFPPFPFSFSPPPSQPRRHPPNPSSPHRRLPSPQPATTFSPFTLSSHRNLLPFSLFLSQPATISLPPPPFSSPLPSQPPPPSLKPISKTAARLPFLLFSLLPFPVFFSNPFPFFFAANPPPAAPPQPPPLFQKLALFSFLVILRIVVFVVLVCYCWLLDTFWKKLLVVVLIFGVTSSLEISIVVKVVDGCQCVAS